MKLLHKKNLKEENYDFFQPTIEKVDNSFKPNSSTPFFQILIWLIIVIVLIILLNVFFIN